MSDDAPVWIDLMQGIGNITLPDDVVAKIDAAVSGVIPRAKERKMAVRAFIRGFEWFLPLLVYRRDRWAKGPRGVAFPAGRDYPRKEEIVGPLNDIDAALNDFSRALNQLPTQYVREIDAYVRYRTTRHALGAEDSERFDDALLEDVYQVVTGGAFEVYLPDSRMTQGLSALTGHLHAAVNGVRIGVECIPRGTKKDYAKRTLVQHLVSSYQEHIAKPSTDGNSNNTPFQRVMREIFRYLSDEHGVTGNSDSRIKKLADEAIRIMSKPVTGQQSRQ